MNLGNVNNKKISYLVCSISESLFICNNKNGKLDTTDKMDEAKVFKTKSHATNMLISMKNNIRKRSSGWKVMSIEKEFFDNKIKYCTKNDFDENGYKHDFEISEDIINDFISLCEKFETLTDIDNNICSIYSKRQNYIDLLAMYDRQQSDILHKIEFEKFNACQGYNLSKSIKILREKRRQVKNALMFIDRTENSKDISVIISEINKLQNKKYSPRILYDN